MNFFYKFKKLSWLYLICVLASSTALVKVTQKLWREISEREAQKRALPLASWAPLVERAQPAVVVISTEAVIQRQPMEIPGLPGPFRFFMPIPPEKQQGLGSGFIINEDGYIITNHHVIAGAQKIRVQIGNNQQEYKAKIIGSDEELDIALIKLEDPQQKNSTNNKKTWPHIPLGDSEKIRLGDWILVLGNPLGLMQSVNMGIVAQKHRNIPGGKLIAELIQLQVPLHPGNSGGPVLNTSGEVIGMSQSILRGGQNISFCLPINAIKTMIPQLKKGRIEKSFLGIEPIDLTPQYAKALGLSPNQKGAVVVQVIQNTPAEKAGIKPMDVILEFDDRPVRNFYDLRQQAAYAGVGKKIKLKIFRKNTGFLYKTVTLEKRPGQQDNISPTSQQPDQYIKLANYGLEIRDTPQEVITNLKLPNNQTGAQVVNITRPSPAQLAGLAPGDVIIRVLDTNINSAKKLEEVLSNIAQDSTVPIITRRGIAERVVPLYRP